MEKELQEKQKKKFIKLLEDIGKSRRKDEMKKLFFVILFVISLLVFIFIIIFIIGYIKQEERIVNIERVVSGYVRDCSFKVGENVSIPSAKISYAGVSVFTLDNGYFSIKVRGDPELLITANGYHNFHIYRFPSPTPQ